MKSTFLLSLILVTSFSTAQAETNFANCTPLTPDQVVLPGNPANVKETALRASSIVLSQGLNDDGLFLTAEFKGADVNGKELNKTISANFGVGIGNSYYSFSADAKDASDSYKTIRMEVEYIVKKDQPIPTQLLFSVLAVGQPKMFNGQPVNVTTTSHSLCDIIQ